MSDTTARISEAEAWKTAGLVVSNLVHGGGPVVVMPDGSVHQAEEWTWQTEVQSRPSEGRFVVAKLPDERIDQ